jgi:Mce-associated membrane protein
MAADADSPEVELSDSAAVEEAADYDATIESRSSVDSDEAAPVGQSTSHVRLATLVGLVVIVGLATLVGWQGFTAYQAHQAQERRLLFIEVGRQGALNLTTIDWHHADADVKRVLDSATGTFFDDFSKRQQPFIEVVKKAQAISKGTITEAGLESESGDEAQVLVAVSVKTSNIGAAEQEPRAWRMRISVQKSGDDAKVSNVAFVP